jgi:hypothetical protein
MFDLRGVRVIYSLLNALLGTYGGRSCRRCAEPIDRRNAFAMSEGVCTACGR